MAYTWIPFYKEFARKLLKYRDNRKPLINRIYSYLFGYINHLKDATDGRRVPDIDPFTVFAIFNRGITIDKRIDICTTFKRILNISAPVPQDFAGIPVMNTQRSNFMAFEDRREDGDIERLWRVFEDAVLDRDIEDSYNALSHQFLIKYNLTIGLFWIRPDKYLPLDGYSQDYLQKLGITFDKNKFLPYHEYKRVMNELNEKMTSESLDFSNYAEFSDAAYKQGQIDSTNATKPKDSTINYWLYAPGENASEWPKCQSEGMMCIHWNDLGNLTQYTTREDIRSAVKRYYPTDGNAKNDSLCLWQFSKELKPGDIVFAKRGLGKIIGCGVVESDYFYDDATDGFKHKRKVKWTHVGEWNAIGKNAMKTLTCITQYSDYVDKLNALVEGREVIPEEPAESAGQHYWWLVANPKIWSLADTKVGEEQNYTLYNSNGHQRRIFQNFINAKQGDIVIGYESSPTKQILGLLEITRENDGKSIYFKKIEDLSNPIDFSVLKATSGLEEMEYMKNQQGSFFKVSPDEYDILMELIREENPLSKTETKEKYQKSDFLREVFIAPNDYDKLKGLLLRKKNLILQGAPGVGKTFAAKRLAYSIMGVKDESRIMQVQFHQNYSYEDFVMGYKPNENGGFDLKKGIFYRFCRKAALDREHEYFFIIDEINRGNMSKIFGELLMLIENDYRDKTIQMAYSDESFAVPSNLYIIGMMNTADRSLAMIDYALRRRFSFFEMKPGFETFAFKEHIKNIEDDRIERLVGAIIALNKVIEDDDSLGSGFCIGHSYLCNIDDNTDLESIMEYDILPMLREYWFDNDEKFNAEVQKLRDAVK